MHWSVGQLVTLWWNRLRLNPFVWMVSFSSIVRKNKKKWIEKKSPEDASLTSRSCSFMTRKRDKMKAKFENWDKSELDIFYISISCCFFFALSSGKSFSQLRKARFLFLSRMIIPRWSYLIHGKKPPPTPAATVTKLNFWAFYASEMNFFYFKYLNDYSNETKWRPLSLSKTP